MLQRTKLCRLSVLAVFLFFFNLACHANSVIGFYEERDLELFDSINKTHEGVFNKLFKTATPFGKDRLMGIMRNPITDVQKLKVRQEQVQRLVNNPELLKQLKAQLIKIGQTASQSHFDSSKEDETAQKAIESLYFERSFLKSLNASPTALNLQSILKDLSVLGPVFDVVVLHLVFEALTGKSGCGHDHGHKHHHEPKNSLLKALKPYVEIIDPYAQTVHFGIAALSFKETVEGVMARHKVLNQVHKKVAHTRLCLQSMDDIGSLMVRYGLSMDSFGSPYQSSDPYLPNPKIAKAEAYEHLNDLLHDKSITAESSLGFASLPGNTLMRHQEMKYSKWQLKSLAETIGDIDALVAVAEWYTQANTDKTKVSTVQFVENAPAPILKMNGFWNPGLNPENVITNDFSLGNSNHPLKNLITGPNKAGKSIILKAAGLNVILAQTFGIAAAESIEMTVFHKIHTYMTVSDDLSQDASGLVAEVLRADTIFKSIKQQELNGFILALIDDTLFKGTTFERGQDLAYRFIKSLSGLSNCAALIATHSFQLKALEKELPGQYKNYRLKVIADNEGKKSSTFKLEEGISDQKSVFDIVESQGYNVSF